jgi:ABC-type polysaccharide/polyol phosphate export permease
MAAPTSRAITVYEPTVTGLPPLREYFQSVWDRNLFIWHMARTKLKAEHYDTVMGVVWLIVDPLVMAGTLYLVRIVFRSSGPPSQAGRVLASLLMGVSFFYLVRDIVQGCAMSIVQNRQMVLNSAAPRACFPAVILVRSLCDLGPALVVYFFIHALTGQPWGFSLILLPLAIVLLVAFSLGLGLLCAPLVVYFRDVGALLPYLLRVWMYVTPVMFLVTEIPPAWMWLFRLNPLFPFFAMLEQIFAAQWPSPGYLLQCFLWAIGSLLVGCWAFLIRERDYAVRL